MKNRLKKSSLKVLGFEFSEGRKLIADLKQNRARRYPLSGGVRLSIFHEPRHAPCADGAFLRV